MASSRVTSLPALNKLATAGSKRQFRGLHMTGANSNPSPLLASQTLPTYSSRAVADLKTECMNRNIAAGGAKAELIERLSSNDLAQSRSFATGVQASRRPLAAQSSIEPQPTRHFNTTRALKAVNDSSTIDFAYMPQLELTPASNNYEMRVPLLPDNFYPARRSAAHQEAIEPVIRPEISLMSGDGTNIASPSAMSEVVDNYAVDLDPYDLTAKVQAAASKMTGIPVEKLNEPGMLKELWNGVLDDVLGAKKPGKA